MHVHCVVRLRPPTNHRLRFHQHRRPSRSMEPNVCSQRTIAWDVTSAHRVVQRVCELRDELLIFQNQHNESMAHFFTDEIWVANLPD